VIQVLATKIKKDTGTGKEFFAIFLIIYKNCNMGVIPVRVKLIVYRYFSTKIKTTVRQFLVLRKLFGF